MIKPTDWRFLVGLLCQRVAATLTPMTLNQRRCGTISTPSMAWRWTWKDPRSRLEPGVLLEVIHSRGMQGDLSRANQPLLNLPECSLS